MITVWLETSSVGYETIWQAKGMPGKMDCYKLLIITRDISTCKTNSRCMLEAVKR